ncbi:hypothetical protein SAMN05443550_102406 [Pedobacter hartonius]|uniref:Uncharacterized protein n=1 Tax=Pedobacter hartonius TaxID=425514 RepID=A0A1H3ZLQ5_9SPHI|nr:hypothetical protein SAMN05443550_102406 [Pedobacter hartonius]
MEGSTAGVIILFKMSRTDQTVMALIADMRLVHTYFTVFGAIRLLFSMMVKSAPWNKCYGKYPKHQDRKELVNM